MLYGDEANIIFGGYWVRRAMTCVSNGLLWVRRPLAMNQGTFNLVQWCARAVM